MRSGLGASSPDDWSALPSSSRPALQRRALPQRRRADRESSPPRLWMPAQHRMSSCCGIRSASPFRLLTWCLRSGSSLGLAAKSLSAMATTYGHLPSRPSRTRSTAHRPTMTSRPIGGLSSPRTVSGFPIPASSIPANVSCCRVTRTGRPTLPTRRAMRPPRDPLAVPTYPTRRRAPRRRRAARTPRLRLRRYRRRRTRPSGQLRSSSSGAPSRCRPAPSWQRRFSAALPPHTPSDDSAGDVSTARANQHHLPPSSSRLRRCVRRCRQTRHPTHNLLATTLPGCSMASARIARGSSRSVTATASPSLSTFSTREPLRYADRPRQRPREPR